MPRKTGTLLPRATTLAALTACVLVGLPSAKARASTIVVNDTTSCAAIGGTIAVGPACRLYVPFTVATNDILLLGMGFQMARPLTIDGVVEVGGFSLETYDDTVNNGTINVGRGGQIVHGAAGFTNNGTIFICGGTFIGTLQGNPPSECSGSCTIGAGIAQAPPKPPKNSGVIKISNGLTATPAVKNTKLTISGTLEDCQDFPAVPDAPGPITAGSFKLSVEIPPGSTCAAMTSGFPVKTALTITWTTPDPAHPGSSKKVGTEKTTLADYTDQGLAPTLLGSITGQAFGVKSKVPGFATKQALLSIAVDQTAAQIALGCADEKGLTSLTFTGTSLPSTLEVR
jgi:hypothetical protein